MHVALAGAGILFCDAPRMGELSPVAVFMGEKCLALGWGLLAGLTRNSLNYLSALRLNTCVVYSKYTIITLSMPEE